MRGSGRSYTGNRFILGIDRAIEFVMYKFESLENVIFVTSAGNGKPEQRIWSTPESLGIFKQYTRLVVVGATNNRLHNVHQFNDSYVNMVWAPTRPALHLTFPHPAIAENLIEDHMYYAMADGGTSTAAALVTGLLANYISQNLDSKTRMDDAVTKLKELAHARIPKDAKGEPLDPQVMPVAWNGIPTSLWPLEDQREVAKAEQELKDAKPVTSTLPSP
ncbi:hypothetical protein TWF506_005880 [Arthrobotrys conoides]|uniref:Peptidase S8/S53 domain-containing protein n=1 Tax=Arthrobotrys conoides TaxID=74498 RepID=A0AAN8S3X2_9PEZI